MRSDLDRLRDILESIERIYRYAGSGTEAFDNNELIQNWVVSHIQVIGEAASRLSQKLQAKHPEVPWKQIVGMRHILVHHYFGIDIDVVRAVLEKDIPDLRAKVEAMVKDLESPTASSSPAE